MKTKREKIKKKRTRKTRIEKIKRELTDLKSKKSLIALQGNDALERYEKKTSELRRELKELSETGLGE